jgi:heme/copper-type cytochrome/quinol oxidase subunit 3
LRKTESTCIPNSRFQVIFKWLIILVRWRLIRELVVFGGFLKCYLFLKNSRYEGPTSSNAVELAAF